MVRALTAELGIGLQAEQPQLAGEWEQLVRREDPVGLPLVGMRVDLALDEAPDGRPELAVLGGEGDHEYSLRGAEPGAGRGGPAPGRGARATVDRDLRTVGSGGSDPRPRRSGRASPAHAPRAGSACGWRRPRRGSRPVRASGPRTPPPSRRARRPRCARRGRERPAPRPGAWRWPPRRGRHACAAGRAGRRRSGSRLPRPPPRPAGAARGTGSPPGRPGWRRPPGRSDRAHEAPSSPGGDPSARRRAPPGGPPPWCRSRCRPCRGRSPRRRRGRPSGCRRTRARRRPRAPPRRACPESPAPGP